MGNKKKNIIWTIICALVCVIFVPIIVVNIVISVKGAVNPDELPSVFGYSPTVVMTGSMEPEFEAKDLIFIKEIDIDTLKAKEDVICFFEDGYFVTHRIERIEIVDGVKRFYTKGDANNTEDIGFVLADQIQGKYVGKVEGAGGVILFLQDPYGLMLTIILLLLLYIAGELLIECIGKKKENKLLTEENNELKKQLDKYAQMATTQVVVNDNPEGIIINENQKNIKYKYKRSFLSRLIQSGENTQSLYTAVKNYLLRYDGVKGRNSWGSENFSYKRNPIAKLCIKGKTLYAYLALSDQQIANLQIDERVESNKYSAVPAKIRITGIIKLNRALKAIDAVCQSLGLTLGKEITENYSYPFETDEQLLQKGLIKLVESNFTPPVQDDISQDDIMQEEVISDVEDIILDKLTETQKFTRQQYLALPRTKKKKIKALIRQVDEHLFDEDTPSNERKRQVAEMWRDAVIITNK